MGENNMISTVLEKYIQKRFGRKYHNLVISVLKKQNKSTTFYFTIVKKLIHQEDVESQMFICT